MRRHIAEVIMETGDSIMHTKPVSITLFSPFWASSVQCTQYLALATQTQVLPVLDTKHTGTLYTNTHMHTHTAFSWRVHPLNQLLPKHTPWKWSTSCQYAFESSKHALLLTMCLSTTVPSETSSRYLIIWSQSCYFTSICQWFWRPIAFCLQVTFWQQEEWFPTGKSGSSTYFLIKNFINTCCGACEWSWEWQALSQWLAVMFGGPTLILKLRC